MDPRPLIADIFLFVTLIVAIGCFTGIMITLIKRRGYSALSRNVDARLDEIANRLSRLDTSVDAVAVEVERISEAQRFTAKVLAERSGAAISDRSRAGQTTPH